MGSWVYWVYVFFCKPAIAQILQLLKFGNLVPFFGVRCQIDRAESSSIRMSSSFPENAPCAEALFYRSYSRRNASGKPETWAEVAERNVRGLQRLGRLSDDEAELIKEEMLRLHALPSGRWLWVGGSEWSEKPENVFGSYNCLTGDTFVWAKTLEDGELKEGFCRADWLSEQKDVQITDGNGDWVPVDFVCTSPRAEVWILRYRLVVTKNGEIEERDDFIRTTGNHAFFLSETNESVEVQDLKKGDRLRSATHLNTIAGYDLGYCEVIEVRKTEVIEPVYCCQVPTTESFDLLFLHSHNCSSSTVDSVDAFGYMMDLAMQGCGTGAILEDWAIAKLPPVTNRLSVEIVGKPGDRPKDLRIDGTIPYSSSFGGDGELDHVELFVGDSRQGWVDAYKFLIDVALGGLPFHGNHAAIDVDLSNVRPAGEPLEGFGGVANPIKLPDLFTKVADILNGAYGRQLTALECCLLIDEAALVVVAGNVRRSAGMRQFSADDQEAAAAKSNLWQQDEDGTWKIDSKRDALRMANHTRVYHSKPSREEILESVTQQFYSGEGAIQYAPEAIARANADLLNTRQKKQQFIERYCQSKEAGKDYLRSLAVETLPAPEPEDVLEHRMQRYGLNPCLAGETLVHARVKEDGEPLEGFYMAEALAEHYEEVSVMDGNGNWLPVDFRCTDPAAELWELQYEIVIDGNRTYDSIRTTAEHAFFLEASNTPIAVQDLRPGDRLRSSTYHKGVKGYGATYCVVLSVRNTKEVEPVYCCTVPTTHSFDLLYLHSHNCGEILLNDNVCNLSEVHLNRINPRDFGSQYKAFEAAAIVAASLLHHDLHFDRYKRSRELDPIVGVSFTGLFDFFVEAFGVKWLQWWEAGRPNDWGNPVLITVHPLINFGLVEAGEFPDTAAFFERLEAAYLTYWRAIVEGSVWGYCDEHKLKRPNRCTTVQPAGSKSLLTNASPGWHPPKAQRFIRRMTFGRDNPIARACMDYGYSVVPSQSDKDENGRLLDDPFDPRCTEWLVEIPTEVPWANLEGADAIDISKFSVKAQFDFYMQVQRYYVTHNASATVEYTEEEIPVLANCIYEAIQNDEGYISAALLARFEANETFPRLPFEPISKAKYDELMAQVKARRKIDSVGEAIAQHLEGAAIADASEQGPAQCDSDRCLIG